MKTSDRTFAEFKRKVPLSRMRNGALPGNPAKMAAFLKAPERVAKIVEDIAALFKEKVERMVKAMIVTPDRHACRSSRLGLSNIFQKKPVPVVISATANDKQIQQNGG
ncbi:MAG: hypothetical protein R2824_31205 [Saprospiraceae bacterium]